MPPPDSAMTAIETASTAMMESANAINRAIMLRALGVDGDRAGGPAVIVKGPRRPGCSAGRQG
jgi:hypothetical protein